MFYGRSSDGEKTNIKDAMKSARYFCPGCGAPLVQKKGEVNVWHFAHAKGTTCDAFTENKMTEWHLAHQEEFPADCREVRLERDGKVHIADVRVDDFTVEFQHSPIDPETFRERSRFYRGFGSLAWVFDCRKQWEDGMIESAYRRDYPVFDKYGYSVYMGYNVYAFRWKRRKKLFDSWNRGDFLLALDTGKTLLVVSAPPTDSGVFLAILMSPKEFTESILSASGF